MEAEERDEMSAAEKVASDWLDRWGLRWDAEGGTVKIPPGSGSALAEAHLGGQIQRAIDAAVLNVEQERDRLQKFEDALYEIKAERKELKAALSESRAREADTWERVKRLEQEEIPRLKASLRPIQDG